jgi:hypothetical protein
MIGIWDLCCEVRRFTLRCDAIRRAEDSYVFVTLYNNNFSVSSRFGFSYPDISDRYVVYSYI